MSCRRRYFTYALMSLIACLTAAASETASKREYSKPWINRDIQLGNTTLPFSPATVIVLILSIFMFGGIFNGPKSTASASHILLDHPDAKERLAKMKKDINGDYNKFQALAKQHSKCPSGKAAGGKLGTFGPGTMAPPFDKAIFAKENKVGDVIGPIQTSFGWHLIWIEERNLVD